MSAHQEAPGLLGLRTVRRGRAVHVVVSGELDLSGLAAVEAELRRIESERPERIVLDLAAMTFVDCGGMEMVLAAVRRADAVGQDLAVVIGAGAAGRLADLLGLRERLEPPDGRLEPLAG